MRSYYAVSFQTVRFLPKDETFYFGLGCVTVLHLLRLLGSALCICGHAKIHVKFISHAVFLVSCRRYFQSLNKFFQDSHRTVFTFRIWLDLLGVVLALWISILKISNLLQNCWHRVIDFTRFEKHLESSLDHTLNFCRNLMIFRSKNICQQESLTRSSTVI